MYFMAFLLIACGLALLNGSYVEWIVYCGKYLEKIGVISTMPVNDTIRNNLSTSITVFAIVCIILFLVLQNKINFKGAKKVTAAVTVFAFTLMLIVPLPMLKICIPLYDNTVAYKQAEMQKRIEAMQNVDEERFQEVYKAITEGANDIAKEIVNRTAESLNGIGDPIEYLEENAGEDIVELIVDYK